LALKDKIERLFKRTVFHWKTAEKQIVQKDLLEEEVKLLRGELKQKRIGLIVPIVPVVL